jgi:hypothetical protein
VDDLVSMLVQSQSAEEQVEVRLLLEAFFFGLRLRRRTGV